MNMIELQPRGAQKGHVILTDFTNLSLIPICAVAVERAIRVDTCTSVLAPTRNIAFVDV